MKKTFEHLFYHGTVLLHFHPFHLQLLPYSEQQLWLGKKDSSYVQKFMTNFSSKLKPQFQVSFGQDSFPMNTSLFQASLSQNSANCFLTNGWWNACFYHYYFYRNVSHLFLLELGLTSKIFLFCRTDNFGRLP